nr:hypothetical protein [Tanacetum cinerariifolium]
MDSVIPNGQKNTLVEYMILSGNQLKTVNSIGVDGVTGLKKYTELSAYKKLQADCDLKATNIILQGLPTDVYALMNHHRIAKDLWEQIQLLMQVHQEACLQPYFVPQIEYIISTVNQNTSCLISSDRLWVTVQPLHGRQSSFTAGTFGTRANISGTGGNNSGQQRVVKDKVLQVEAQVSRKVLNEKELEFLADPRVTEGLVTQTVITHNKAYQADDLDAYDSYCDDFSIAKAVLMANLSSYGSDVLSKLPNYENTHNDMLNQSVVKKDIDEIETINIELEHMVAKQIAENEHLKQSYKQLYDLIKPSCVRVKEHVESLVNQLNQKKFKGKDIFDNAAQVSNATTIDPEMYKIDPVTLAPKDKNKNN